MLCQLSSLKTVSKYGAGERSTQDQTSRLPREQYIASAQVLFRKSLKVGTSEQQALHSVEIHPRRVLEKDS